MSKLKMNLSKLGLYAESDVLKELGISESQFMDILIFNDFKVPTDSFYKIRDKRFWDSVVIDRLLAIDDFKQIVDRLNGPSTTLKKLAERIDELEHKFESLVKGAYIVTQKETK